MAKRRILYVSDLDGTLLNSEKKVTKYTSETIQKFISEGMLFSIATARMPYGCDYRVEELKMNTPGILTNGVFIYDFSNRTYISVETISNNIATQVIEAFHSEELSCFLFLYKDGDISIFYDKASMEEQTQYYSDRALKSCSEVTFCENIKDKLSCGEVCYLTYTGEKTELEKVCLRLDKINGISYAFYLNIYNGLYCLEVFSNKASKKNALKKLIELLKIDELVVFGDNLNDLSMIEIADRSYAPGNALDEVKNLVTEVLEDCDHDGVAKFLKNEWKNR